MFFIKSQNKLKTGPFRILWENVGMKFFEEFGSKIILVSCDIHAAYAYEKFNLNKTAKIK